MTDHQLALFMAAGVVIGLVTGKFIANRWLSMGACAVGCFSAGAIIHFWC